MIAILLDAGAAIDPVGYDGVTPLQTALERGSRFAATTLLMRRADRTSRCGTGESPEELAKKGGLGDLLERDW